MTTTEKTGNFDLIIEPLLKNKKLDGCKNDFLLKAYGIALKFTDGRNSIILFQKLSRGKILQKKSGLISLVFNNQTISLFEQDVLRIESKFDFIYESWNEKVWVLNFYPFEQIMGYNKIYLEHAESVMKAVKKLKIISGCENFLESCRNDQRKLRKLMSVSKNATYNVLNVNRVRAVIEAHNLALNLNSNGLILYNNANDDWELLHLLDDDYLYSEITKKRYAALTKKES